MFFHLFAQQDEMLEIQDVGVDAVISGRRIEPVGLTRGHVEKIARTGFIQAAQVQPIGQIGCARLDRRREAGQQDGRRRIDLLDRIACLAQHLGILDGIDLAPPPSAQIRFVPNLIVVDTIAVAQRQGSREAGELKRGGWGLEAGRCGPQRRGIKHGDEVEIAAVLHDAIPLLPIELALFRLNLRPRKSLADPAEARLLDLRELGLELRFVVLFQSDVRA